MDKGLGEPAFPWDHGGYSHQNGLQSSADEISGGLLGKIPPLN